MKLIYVFNFQLVFVIFNECIAEKKGDSDEPLVSPIKRKELPWENLDDSPCRNLSVMFGKPKQFPLRGIVGFMGSGNKWIEQLIQFATGYYISDIIRPDRVTRGFLGRFKVKVPSWQGMTTLTRSHDAGYRIIRPTRRVSINSTETKRVKLENVSEIVFNFRGILIIRNPWEAIFSSYQHIHAHSFVRTINDLNRNKYARFFKRSAKAWKAVAERWISGTPSTSDLLIVKYEDMKENPGTELKKMTRFLNLTVDAQRINCTVMNPTEKWIRKPLPAHVRAQLEQAYTKNPGMSNKVASYIKSINSLLEKRGFSTRLNYTRPHYTKKLRK